MSFVTSMLSESGVISSKRVVTFLAFLLCGGGYIAMVCGYSIDSKIFDSMMYIVIAGLGFTASEKFTKKEDK
jgi:hypothetical protein